MVELERQNKKENTKIYNSVCNSIRSVLGENILIDHVGSTAIPNMYGKNIIDILIGVKNECEMESFTLKLKEIGYFPGKNSNGLIYRFFANRKEETKKGDMMLV